MMVMEYTSTQFVARLSELSADDVDRAGAKAANEAELLQAGLRVPDAIVLTTNAFNHFLEANQIGAGPASEQILAGSFPQAILDALHSGVAWLEEYPVAVRSSSVAEDLPDASFAGQYETFLNVEGPQALEAAVQRCWASAFSQHAVAYRLRKGLPTNSMAVLIQKMIPAKTAGVAFSANPVTGERDAVVVNAVRGLGERLVSGQASPDEWTVTNGQVKCHRAPEGAITADQVSDVAKMARQVEAHFGTPQDIEWAFADGRLYVLQARPITRLPDAKPDLIPIPIEAPPGFWQQDASRFPKPTCPMMWMVAQAAIPGIELMASEFGLLMDGQEFASIGGWTYNRMKPLGGKEPPPVQPPKPIMWLLVRLIPMMRARIKKAQQAIREDKPGRFIRHWYDEWLPELESRIAEYRDRELGDLPDSDIVQYLEEVLAFTQKTISYHALLNTSVNLLLFELVATCRELLGWDEGQAFRLVSGTSYKSTEPAVQLNNLAQMALARSAVRSQKADQARVILGQQPEALARFERVLERARMAYPIREANQFYTFSAPLALIRYAVLEVGRRLADRGAIVEWDDAFFLYKEEACSALLDGGDHRNTVRHRKGEMAWAAANPGPPFYGEPPAAPAFDFLPREARLIMESLIWSFHQMMAYEGSQQQQVAGETLKGIPASTGEYTGPVRVIMDESEFDKIQPGDVMLCPMTSPVWSVLFPTLGALVTDTGGLLSHPAIITREYQIPAVVATGNGTSILQDGEVVTVYGAAGEVESHS